MAPSERRRSRRGPARISHRPAHSPPRGAAKSSGNSAMAQPAADASHSGKPLGRNGAQPHGSRPILVNQQLFGPIPVGSFPLELQMARRY